MSNDAVVLSDSASSSHDTFEIDTADDVPIQPKARPLPGPSKPRYTYKWRVRRGNHTSSASTSSRPTEHPEEKDGSVLTQVSATNNSNSGPKASSTQVLSLSNIQIPSSIDTVVLKSLIVDIADMEPLLKSPAAWGVPDDLYSTRLVSATIKPHAGERWLLTATFARISSAQNPARDLENDVDSSDSSVDDHDHSSSLFSVHHDSSNGSRSQLRPNGTRRGGWGKQEDRKLMRWRRRGEAWPWILKQFPERTEGAVKARWYMLVKQWRPEGPGGRDR
ncbi:hypothetical protein H2200_008116 [Cladophialophora chaetospira]|uniref:Myb-like domain-containing protein n=1 Tax=Cladophialophora chaetospira TaxID=386627 RepID=A0AA39CFU1_9EURO|nr:hypothetical protein H2200_008116 [Cladophialophora chaetospira]